MVYVDKTGIHQSWLKNKSPIIGSGNPRTVQGKILENLFF